MAKYLMFLKVAKQTYFSWEALYKLKADIAQFCKRPCEQMYAITSTKYSLKDVEKQIID